jgi:uncharacterized membrane protein YbhN (UPF0104 family)/tRNA A-37 threonylcarbamoyl transferase component Bud32
MDQKSLHGEGNATHDVDTPVSGVPKSVLTTVLPAQVEVEEPPEPRRIRRPPDLMRLLFETALIVVVLLLAIPGASTTTGLETDIHNNLTFAPQLFLSTITLLSNVATAVIPVGLAIERLYRRDRRRVADAVIAAAIAWVAASLLNLWIDTPTAYSPDWLSEVLTRHLNTSTTTALHVYIATLVAFLTIIGFGDRPALRTFTWTCVFTYAAATLINGNSALVGLIVTFLLGRTVAFGWRYAHGVDNARPNGHDVVASLFDAGLEPVSCRWVGEGEDTRRYVADTHDGRLLDVIVLDRDRQAVGLVYRLYRRIRLRGPAQRRNLLSFRRAVDQEALMSYALRDVGIRTPRLLAVRELSADAALLAYERIDGRTLDKLDADELTDELLARIWQLQQQMQQHQMAHRRFALDSLLVDRDGQIWLLDLRNGEVAASGLQTRLDIAELMATLALRFGAERTVRVGTQVLGVDAIGSALPMLQPVVLTRTTRSAVRKSKDLLKEIREQILIYQPQATHVAEPVKLERLSPRTLLTVGAGCVAAYLVLYQLTSSKISPAAILRTASPWWAIVAVLASVATYVAAGMVLTGFIPEKLPVVRNFLVQVAAGFVSIVAPAAVGGVALNTRYLQKQGIGTGPAVSAVGASQAVGFVMHISLIAAFGFIANTGSNSSGSYAPSTVIIAILLSIAMIVMVTIGIPPLRKFAVMRLKPFFEGTLPRLLDVAQNPEKLAIGLGGTIVLSLMNALCLWASILAIQPHAHITYATTAVVFLTAQAVGSVIPVPSGIGTVELAMAGALTSIGGLPASVGTPAVFLFRMLRTYLPVIPGYFAFTHLQRKGAL